VVPADAGQALGIQCRELQVPAECSGLRLDQALARMFPEHSRSRLQAWLKEGVLQFEGGPAQPSRTVLGGERVQLAEAGPAVHAGAEAQALPLAVVHEDADLIVIDKPAGLVVHPGAGNPDHTLVNALLAPLPGATVGHRRGRTPRHRPPDRQGHLRAAGRCQDRRRA